MNSGINIQSQNFFVKRFREGVSKIHFTFGDVKITKDDNNKHQAFILKLYKKVVLSYEVYLQNTFGGYSLSWLVGRPKIGTSSCYIGLVCVEARAIFETP